jgi:hypothetical protein
MVKTIVQIALTGTIICGAWNSRAAAQSVQILAVMKCQEWTDARRAPLSNQPMEEMEYGKSMWVQGWALGYVSGLAVGSGRDISKGLNWIDVWKLIDDECRRSPQASVADVLDDWSRGRH